MSVTGLEKIEAELREIRRILKDQGLVKVAVNFTEAAQMLGVSPKHVGRMVRRGDLATVSVGGARRIPVSEIQRVLEPSAAPAPTRHVLKGIPESVRLRAMLKARP